MITLQECWEIFAKHFEHDYRDTSFKYQYIYITTSVQDYVIYKPSMKML